MAVDVDLKGLLALEALNALLFLKKALRLWLNMVVHGIYGPTPSDHASASKRHIEQLRSDDYLFHPQSSPSRPLSSASLR
ncbi:MAG: hypothetical protein QXM16_08790 [Nitrososphaerota archaeon]